MVAGDRLPKGAVKLLLNLAMIAGDALVRGGRLDVGAERSDGALEMVIRAEGPRILLDPSCARRSSRAARAATVEPRAAGAWLAHALAAEAGGHDPAQRPGGRGADDRGHARRVKFAQG